MEFSEQHIDALRELVNIGVGRSASSLNRIIGKKISLQVPSLEIIDVAEIANKLTLSDQGEVSVVDMKFKGEIAGITELIFPVEGAHKLINLIAGDLDPQQPIDQVKANILNEIGNIILNSLIGTISNILKTRLHYNIPKYSESNSIKLIEDIKLVAKSVVFAETKFTLINTDINGSFLLILEVASFEKLKDMLDTYLNQ